MSNRTPKHGAGKKAAWKGKPVIAYTYPTLVGMATIVIMATIITPVVIGRVVCLVVIACEVC